MTVLSKSFGRRRSREGQPGEAAGEGSETVARSRRPQASMRRSSTTATGKSRTEGKPKDLGPLNSKERYCRALWSLWRPRSLLLALGKGAEQLSLEELTMLIDGAWKLLDGAEALEFLKGKVGIARLRAELAHLRPILFRIYHPLRNSR